MSAAPVQAQSSSSLHLLDVPYLPQTESLCGGAAIAMVMRYWGAANVYAETFADLVDPAAGGITGEALLGALRARGWTAQSFRGDAPTVTAYLAERRPVVALIQDRPGRFHYVVVVGWPAGRVIVHDPARAPFRVIDDKVFDAAWKASDYWSLIAIPPATGSADGLSIRNSSETIPPERVGAKGPCTAMVDEGVRLAGAGDAAGARRLFEVAAEQCPDAAGPWREMAGLRALTSDWPGAAVDARKALSKDPGDPLALRILATALYLDNDPDGALAAWNRAGEPIIDLVRITGLERTRYEVASRAMGLHPQRVLTLDDLRAARRRLADLPAAQTARAGFRPADNGRAQVDAVVLERPLLPTSRIALAALGLHAITDREVSASLASPTGGGELWTASWRWWAHRPRAGVRFDAPAPFGGVWGVNLFDERQSYSRAGASFVEARRRAEFAVSRWTARGLRWDGAVAFDRLRDARMDLGGRSFSITGGAQQRFAGDRASLEARAGSWAGDFTTWTFSLRSEWQSSTRHEGQVWTARAGGDFTGARAPLALWPGAGTGQARDVLLRAHPLLDEGVIRNAAFGRQLVAGGGEWRRWASAARKPVRAAPALFVDVARAHRGLDTAIQRWQFDAGAGLRLALPGSGVLRVDVARGLRDRRTAVSVGWTK